MDESKTPQKGPVLRTAGQAGSAGTPTIPEIERCIATLMLRGASLSVAERNELAQLAKLRKELGARHPIDLRSLAPR